MSKKLTSVLSGILAFVLIVIGFKAYMNAAVDANAAGIRNHRRYERYWSSDVQKRIMDEKTLPIFGSSELTSLTPYENGVGSFLNGDEMNILTIGGGGFQSLSHAMTLGSIAENIQSGKVALLLSPQWFGESGISQEAFAARFSEDHLLQFLQNPDISAENKQYVLRRTVDLLTSSPTQQSRVIRYQQAMDNPFSIDFLYTKIMSWFWRYRSEFAVFNDLDAISHSLPSYDLSSLDFQEILALAQQQGEAACTNNEFGIYDEYFDTYVKEVYEAGEVMEKRQVYTESVEYDDLHCFLNTARELGLQVILVSIPVHGQWYDYQGSLCSDYYEKVRQVAAMYDHIQLIDLSEYAYEPYFLKDIMHLGWKGWARINEALYTAFVQ